MEVKGKRVFIVLDEPKVEEVKIGGFQKDFTPKVIKPTTATVAHVGHEVTLYKEGDRVFVGDFYPEKPTEVPGVGSFTIVTEDSIIAKL